MKSLILRDTIFEYVFKFTYDVKEVVSMSNYTGTIKWFDNERGYGFISTNEGQDVFVHHSQVKEKSHHKDLHEGEAVNFDIREDKEGLAAMNVQKL